MSDDPALDNLKRKIQDAKKESASEPQQKKSSYNLGGRFFNIGADLVAGVFVGVGLGLFVDWVFKISPWGLISFFILGSVTGMVNVYRSLKDEEPKNKKDTHV
ncbi:AtpZ/AtpI family protein [Kamptonema cortianum]|nr:AtpZ/AtpI family protein [Geitlerinema splendidum]MDK3155643.1 AtpZ/AtpI family protein [Kamptonema cortianum]